MDFDDLFSEYWRKVVAEGDNTLDKKAIARNAFAAGLAIRPTPLALDKCPACAGVGYTREDNRVVWCEPCFATGIRQ